MMRSGIARDFFEVLVRVAVVMADAAVRGHLCNGDDATMCLFTADMLELNGGVADMEVIAQHVIEFGEDARAL